MKFEKVKLKEICKVIDSLHKTPIYEDKGIPMVRVTDLREGYFSVPKDAKLVSREVFREFSKKHIPKFNDILMSRVGSYGITSIIKTEEKFCLGQNTVVMTDFSESILSEYLFYYLISWHGKKLIEKNVTGSTQKTISLKSINNFDIIIPEKLYQIKVIRILSTLNKKIEVNNKIIDNLEAQAQGIFKSWFVDFEPFADGDFVESDLGLIPKGWEVKSIGELCKIRSGKRPETRLEKGHIPIYGANGITGWTDKELISEPSILIGRVGTLGKVQKMNKKLWASDNTLIFTSPVLEFIYFHLIRVDYNSLNRGSTQPLIAQKDISNLKIICPDNKIMDNFLKFIGKYFEYIFKLELENNKLASIRDTLLPKLMAGEIDISNISIED